MHKGLWSATSKLTYDCVLLYRPELETWVWTLELRENLWATDRKVSHLLTSGYEAPRRNTKGHKDVMNLGAVRL